MVHKVEYTVGNPTRMPPKRARRGDATAMEHASHSPTDGKNLSKTMKKAVASTSTSTSTSFLATLLHQVQTMSRDKNRCSEALMAFMDGRCSLGLPGETHAHDTTISSSASTASHQKEEHLDCYWILLATHTIHRLTHHLSSSLPPAESTLAATKPAVVVPPATTFAHDNPTVATKNGDAETVAVSIVLALLCHALTNLLLSDRIKLERCANAATASATVARSARSIVGRAIVAITIGSTTSLTHLVSTTRTPCSASGSTNDHPPSTEDADAPAPQQHSYKLLRNALWSALSSLEMVVHMTSSSSSNNKDDTESEWSPAQKRLLQDTLPIDDDNDQEEQQQQLALSCQMASQLLNSEQTEQACISTLLEKQPSSLSTPETAASATPTATASKRSSRRRGNSTTSSHATDGKDNKNHSSSNHSVLQSFHSLLTLYPHNTIMLEGRVSIRRWASMVFVWLCQGQMRILEVVNSLTACSDRNYWRAVLECPAHAPCYTQKQQGGVIEDASLTTTNNSGTARENKARQGRDQKKTSHVASSVNPTTTSLPIRVLGNVATVALAARLVDILSESGNACGVRPPTGGMDTFAAAALFPTGPLSLTSSASASLSTNKRSSRSPKKSTAQQPQQQLHSGTRPDIRDLATVCIYQMLQVHSECTQQNYNLISEASSTHNCLLLNEDVGAYQNDMHSGRSIVCITRAATNTDGVKATKTKTSLPYYVAQYYPLLHKSIDILCRAAASSTIVNSVDMSDSLRRLSGLAAAFALGSIGDGGGHPKEGESNTYTATALSIHSSLVIDAKLCAFAVNQLSDCLRNILAEEESASSTTRSLRDNNDAIQEELLHAKFKEITTEYKLDQALLVPSLLQHAVAEKPCTRRKNVSDSSRSSKKDLFVCTFAGVFPNKEETTANSTAKERISNTELLSLFLRAMATRNFDKYSTNMTTLPTAEALLSKLFSIVRCCYDMHKTSPSLSSESSLKETAADASPRATKGGAKKRVASKIGSTKKKRRKTEKSGEIEGASTVALAEKRKSVSMSSVRATLATDVMNALRMCLIHPTSTLAPTSSSKKWLRLSLRRALTTAHLCEFVFLGHLLDKSLIKARVTASNSTGAVSRSTTPSSFFSSASTNNDFTHFEKGLWTSHINMCLTIGRGQPSYDPNKLYTQIEPILGNAERRLAVFQAIGKAEMECGPCNEDPGILQQWCLRLPAVHQALLASNLTSEPFPSNAHDAAAERFIADTFISRISTVLKDLTLIGDGDYCADSNRDTDQIPYNEELPDDIPMSLTYSRIFVLAVSRLPLKEQHDCVSKWVEIMLSSLSSIVTDDAARELVTNNSKVSSYLARLCTALATMVTIVRVGPSLGEALFLQVGATEYQLPTQRNFDLDSVEGNNSWYRRETCFMGMFSDWESPTIPDVSIPNSLNAISGEIVTKIGTVLELSLSLGFASAKNDKCHLLFASWNALGKKGAWDEVRPTKILKMESKSICEDNLPHLLAELRDDMCCVHRSIYGSSRSITDSLLSGILKAQECTHRRNSLDLKESLKSMMSKAESLIDHLIKENNESHVSLEVFCLFEVLSAYIAFIIAEHTKPDENVFTSRMLEQKSHQNKKRSMEDDDDLLARARANLHSDESDESDCEYPTFEDGFDDDAKIEAISQLHDVCSAFGAAPTHPDWLDTKTRIREGITAADAAKAAESALNCLTKLGTFSFTRHMQSLNRALTRFGESDLADESRATLALQLFLSVPEEEEGAASTNQTDKGNPSFVEWKRVIGSLCHLSEEGQELLLNDLVCNNLASVREIWCPNSAQRIFGKLQDPSITIDGWEMTHAELRAGGEWELLLSEALLGSCLNSAMPSTKVDRSRTTRDSRTGSRLQRYEEGRMAFIDAQRWRLIYESSISNLMPCSALLRFVLGGGVGRKSHPFNNPEPIAAGEHSFLLKPLYFNEPIPQIIQNLSKEATGCISKSLAFLSVVSSAYVSTSIPNRACHAVATNLMVDSKSFEDLEGMQLLIAAFSSLLSIQNIRADKNNSPSDAWAIKVALDKIILTIEAQANNADDGQSLKTLLVGESFSCSPASFKYGRLFALLGCRCNSVLSLKSIAGATKNYKELLTEWQSQSLRPAWEWGVTDTHVISELTSLLCSESEEISDDTRCRLARVIAGVSELEYGFVWLSASPKTQRAIFLPSIIDTCNSFDDNRLQNLVKDHLLLPSLTSNTILPTTQHETSKMLCTIFALLLAASSGDDRLQDSKEFTNGRKLLQLLLDSEQTFDCKHVLDLTFLFGSRFDALKDIGLKLMECCTSDRSSGMLVALERFFLFIREMNMALEKAVYPSRLSSAWSTSSPETKSVILKNVERHDAAKAKACTFVLRNGFHEQHWYNCYTCDLLWDKGCCSLCARTCHRGHEVAYSRYSSFFCDCGAESGNALEQNRVACKCLNPTMSPEATSIPGEIEQVNFYQNKNKGDFLVEKEPDHDLVLSNRESPIDPKAIEIAYLSFAFAAVSSIATIKREAKASGWIPALFQLIHCHFKDWESTDSIVISSRQNLLVDNATSDDSGSRSQYVLRNVLCDRKMKVLELQQHVGKTMVPVRAAKANSFKMNLSSDAKTDRLKQAMLTKNDIRRVAIVADSRGRLIIAEPCSLLFCSALPAVNVKYVENPCQTPLSRAQMCILGSASFKFNIVGMSLCRENERHLVVWGTSEACIAILTTQCDGVEKTIALVFDLEPHECETDYLLKCEWMPISQTLVAVACGQFVKIFDIKRVESESRSHAAICYSLTYEAVLRDIVLIPPNCSGASESSGASDQLHFRDPTAQECSVQMFLLLDSGHLHLVTLRLDTNTDLEEQGERYLEPGEGIEIPTTGVRIYSGASPDAHGATSRSFGEGSSLKYLSQSGILLYTCVSSCVLALLLDAKGKVSGSFEMLPQVVNSEVVGNGQDGYDVTGPYSHWTELGVVEEENSSYFRIACVGKSSNSNQPKILCLEFNESCVRVKKLVWAGGSSMGLGLSLSTSFDGMAAFSAPMLASESNENANAKNGPNFEERVYLVAVTSNGSMLFYGEDTCPTSNTQRGKINLTVPRRRALSDSFAIRKGSANAISKEEVVDEKKMMPTFPLTIFEGLVNASDFDELSFGGDGIGSELGSGNKSSGSSVFVMSPTRDGCTITVHFKSTEKREKKAVSEVKKKGISGTSGKSTPRDPETHRSDLVVVAVRILVGSTSTDFIPKQVFLEGRPVDLKYGVKRWYDLPLTREEVALGVRNGFFSIGIGPSFDSSNNPLVDAVEVYAMKRGDIDWLPTSPSNIVCGNAGKDDNSGRSRAILEGKHITTEGNLIMSMQATTHVCQALGIGEHVAGARATLQELIQATAIDTVKRGKIRECAIDLLNQVVDPSAIQVFLDEGTLFGVSRALNNVGYIFDEEIMRDDTEDMSQSPALLFTWSQVRGVMENCLSSATRIAKAHPYNYARSNEKIIVEGVSTASISVGVSKLLEKGMESSMDCVSLVSGLVDLTLTELAIAGRSDAIDQRNFAGFEVISKLLASLDHQIVDECCSAISAYVKSANGPNDAEEQSEYAVTAATVKIDHSAPIAYQCDSCSLFPITNSRYTLLEGDHDIDLCKQCYRVGRAHAEMHDYDPLIDVVIRGKMLCLDENTHLSCQKIKQMQPVPIANAIVEQVEEARRAVQTLGSQPTSNLPEPMIEEDEDDSLQKALRMSLGETVDEVRPEKEDSNGDIANDQTKQEEFISKLFTDILTGVLPTDDMHPHLSHPVPLLKLLLRLTFNSEREDLQISRAKQLAEHLAQHIYYLTKLGSQIDAEDQPRQSRFYLILCLRCLANLLLRKEDILDEANSETSASIEANKDEIQPVDTEGTSTQKTKEKTDPRFVCDVHKVPAVRRRCSNGSHKNRRFYVCGMKRHLRCRYFKWADSDTKVEENRSKVDKPIQKSKYHRDLERLLWDLLREQRSDETNPLHSQLCNVLELNYANYKKSCGAKACLPAEVKSTGGEQRLVADDRDSSSMLCSIYDRQAALIDLNDGVFCCKERLGNYKTRAILQEKPKKSNFAKTNHLASTANENSVIEASLELLALVAANSTRPGTESETLSSWYPVLCEIISSSTATRFRALAKSVLKRLCGGRRAMYHSIRDHYVFGFQFRNLLQNAQGPLEASVVVRERARQCGNYWKTGEEVSWSNLQAGGLLGTQDLIAEDVLTVECQSKISAVLDELMAVTRNRGGNWRQFCGLPSLPRSQRKSKSTDGSISKDGSISEEILSAFNMPPIISLMWVACALSGPIQVKAFDLMDVALNANERGSSSTVTTDNREADDDSAALSSDVGTDFEFPMGKAQLISGGQESTPEDALLNDQKGLNAEEVHAFIMQFVFCGQSADLRKVASGVARSLCRKLSGQDLHMMFMRLLGAPYEQIGLLGCDCVEFLDLLQAIVRGCVLSDSFQLRGAARIVIKCFNQQIGIVLEGSYGETGDGIVLETTKEGITTSNFLDFTFCAHCHRKVAAGPVINETQECSVNSEANKKSARFRALERDDRGASSASARDQSSQRPWVPDQVRPFVRAPLKASTEGSVSSEFASYVQLKFRLAISDIHLTVSDPRGRFVKTVAVYFTPRQVNNASSLKSEEYSSTWQRCATLSLPRGTAKATCVLTTPVIAANLKFEYLDFYGRPGGSRSADGGLILHCPRCTRVVNHAHGVCGHCGEVAFQCRKCRHINYDRLDAFLCVECGYCSSGGFTYEFTAGIASNAVAIVDEEGYNRAVKILRVATKLHEDLEAALKARISRDRKRPRRGSFSSTDELSMHGPHLKRAFLGELPRPGAGRGGGRGHRDDGFGGSAIASNARRGESSSRAAAANKARSLLRLARQMRRESSSNSERTRSGDFLVRQAFLSSGSRGLAIDNMDDDDGDMCGILDQSDGGDMLPMDSSDPLSRLVASIQARVRENPGRDEDEEENGGDGGGSGSSSGERNSKNVDSSPKAIREECERLYQLMREAERECFELQRRINAWKDLENDALADLGSLPSSTPSFLPSHCSACSSPVTLHLLLLVMEMFHFGMKQVEDAVTEDFVRALFVEQVNMDSVLLDLKRLVITTLATKSRLGTRMVLAELQARLMATRDVMSAELLGKILEIDFDQVDGYVQLAMETMHRA